MKKLTLSEKILKLLEKEDIKIGTLEKKIKVANGTLRKSIEKNSDSLSKYVNKIAEVYPDYEVFLKMDSINTDFVKSENTGNQNNTVNESENTYNKSTLKSLYGENALYVPVEAMTGFLNSITSNSMIKNLTVINLPPEYKNVNFVFQVEGDSMYSAFSNGDHIGCRYIDTKKYLRFGDPYILDIGDGGLILKRIFKSEKGEDYVILRSDNIGYDDIEVHKDDIQHLFLVTSKLSKNVGARYFEKQMVSMSKALEDISAKLLQA